jgi:Fe-S-cluster containining protein
MPKAKIADRGHRHWNAAASMLLTNAKLIPAAAKRKQVKLMFKAVSEITTTEVNKSLKEMHGAKIVCELGCSRCCYRPIVVHSGIEEDNITEAIKELGTNPSTRETIRKAAWIAEEKLSELVHEEGSNYVTLPDRERIAGLWLNMHIPCPLLSPDHLCLIYRSRPLECNMARSYSVTDCAVEKMHAFSDIKDVVDICHKIDEAWRRSYHATNLLSVISACL